MKLYIGIDPGLSGGVAFIPASGEPWAHKMPETDRDLIDLLRDSINLLGAGGHRAGAFQPADGREIGFYLWRGVWAPSDGVDGAGRALRARAATGVAEGHGVPDPWR